MAKGVSPSRRVQIMDDFAANEVAVSDGFAFRTDAALELAYNGWCAMGRPRRAAVGLSNEASGQEKVVVTVREDGQPTKPAEPPAPKVLTW